MKVASVMLNFRRALVALVPSVEHVGIPWKRPDAYDEWDKIATTLFDQLVVEVLRWTLPDKEQEDFYLPPYDLLIPDYAELSSLEVTHPTLREGRWIFHAFGTTRDPFDTLEVREVSEEGQPLGDDLTTCSVESAGFRLRLLDRNFSDP